MDKQKVLKFVVRNGIGLIIAAAIGYIVKAEHKLEEAIDKRMTPKPTTPEN